MSVHTPLISRHPTSVGTKLSAIDEADDGARDEKELSAAEGANDCAEAKGAARDVKAKRETTVFMVLEVQTI